MTKPIKKSRIKVQPDTNKASFDLIKDGIKKNPLFKKPYNTKKVEAANIIKENCKPVKHIVSGQLVLFDYFTPRTKEELEYYDATPLVIYFNTYNSKEGPRVIGFNIHYFPPKIRYRIMDLVYKMFKPMFRSKEVWEDGVSKEANYFKYDFLIEELSKYNLSFAVRQYDPSLMKNARLIPTKWFSTAMLTEGNFKKETRAQILGFWKNWSPNPSKKKATAQQNDLNSKK